MIYDIRHGDCIEVMRTMADCSVDSIVTDPPYGLSFMGKRWDYDVPSVEVWAECLRVLKPGGHLLAFAGTRTQHRMAVRIEDAGFEIRDMIAWVYGSGFPKSLDVSKAIDKETGVDTRSDERWVPTPHPVTGFYKTASGNSQQVGQALPGLRCLYSPATPSARQWSGWGTALKPAMEPITVARKPLCGTVAENVLTHGTGAINVDGCRVGTDGGTCRDGKASEPNDSGWENMRGHGIATINAGRWPANLIHDGSEEPTDLMGSAARFFYCAKASKADRDEGMDATNHHPTVKPTDLMRYLCRLVTPPGGVILDPFTGSGSTGKAAIIEGFRFVGIEREAEYVAIARERIGKAVDAPLFVQTEPDKAD